MHMGLRKPPWKNMRRPIAMPMERRFNISQGTEAYPRIWVHLRRIAQGIHAIQQAVTLSILQSCPFYRSPDLRKDTWQPPEVALYFKFMKPPARDQATRVAANVPDKPKPPDKI
jgi:hypothetical protein